MNIKQLTAILKDKDARPSDQTKAIFDFDSRLTPAQLSEQTSVSINYIFSLVGPKGVFHPKVYRQARLLPFATSYCLRKMELDCQEIWLDFAKSMSLDLFARVVIQSIKQIREARRNQYESNTHKSASSRIFKSFGPKML